jgi:DNA-binding phage protein
MANTKTTHPALTPEKLSEIRKLRAQVELEKPEIIAAGKAVKARHDRIRQVIADLKSARQSKGLTLDAVALATGIAKPNLSRLENDEEPNPTIDTLLRVADAVGYELLR